MTGKIPERRAWRTDKEWARLHERITAGDPAVRRFFGRARWMTAAAAVVIIAGGVSWRLSGRSRSQQVATTPTTRVATTGVGERLTVRLGDSSVVTLGPMSTIRYSNGIGGRSVLLDGVAEFKVVHDVARPFRVRAKNAVVTDVGTEFVVRAYAADSGVDVSVTTGIVTVSGDSSHAVELRSGQVAFVTAAGLATKVAGASAQTRAEWADGHLVFDNAPLGTVARELGRWFDVAIRIPTEQVAHLRLSTVQSQPTLSGVLDAITATLPVRYHRDGNVVTILPAPR